MVIGIIGAFDEEVEKFIDVYKRQQKYSSTLFVSIISMGIYNTLNFSILLLYTKAK